MVTVIGTARVSTTGGRSVSRNEPARSGEINVFQATGVAAGRWRRGYRWHERHTRGANRLALRRNGIRHVNSRATAREGVVSCDGNRYKANATFISGKRRQARGDNVKGRRTLSTRMANEDTSYTESRMSAANAVRTGVVWRSVASIHAAQNIYGNAGTESARRCVRYERRECSECGEQKECKPECMRARGKECSDGAEEANDSVRYSAP